MVLTGSFVLSPAIGLFVTVIGGVASADLTPASRRQDHTTSPSAAYAFVFALPRPPHPYPTFVTIAKRPSQWVGTSRDILLIWVQREEKYF
jgi:hypothetical protein